MLFNQAILEKQSVFENMRWWNCWSHVNIIAIIQHKMALANKNFIRKLLKSIKFFSPKKKRLIYSLHSIIET